MAEGLEAGGVKECKGFSPPSVSTTNAASPRVPLGSLVSNTPTATPSRRTLTEDLGSAGAKRGDSKRDERSLVVRGETSAVSWGQVYGEGAAHERVTLVCTTVNPIPVSPAPHLL